jgi:high potential iron-sulfur protein
MSDDFNLDACRRHFIGRGIIGLAVVPLGSLVMPGSAQARGGIAPTGPQIVRLPETDQQAVALSYAEDAAMVDTTRFKRTEGGVCGNCQLYSGSENAEWGPCAIFSSRPHPTLNISYVVSAKGWCRSWGPRNG